MGRRAYEEQLISFMLLIAGSLITESNILNIIWVEKYIKYTIYEKYSEKWKLFREA